MSASREKKQRQGAGPSDKAAQAQQEQAARKRKTVTYTVIGVVAAAAVAALLIWNSGFFQSRSTAATLGSSSLTTAELSYYYYGTRNYYGTYGPYIGSTFDSSVADDEQMADAANNVTWRDQFLEEALTAAQQELALYDAAIAAGYSDADVKDDLDSTVSSVKSAATSQGYSYASYLRAAYGPYMSTGLFEKLTSRSLLAELFQNDKTDEFSKGYTQDELKEYYDADDHADTLDTFEYSYLYFTPAEVSTKDANGNDLPESMVKTKQEKALDEAKNNAAQALEEYNSGEELSQLIERYSPATSGDHVTSMGTGTLNTVYRDKLLELKADEAAVVENSTSGYYLVVFHSRGLSDVPTRDVRHILVRAETTTDESGAIAAPTDEAWAAAKEKIDAIQAEWENGGKTEESFAALANEKSDEGDGTTGGLYERRSEGSFVTEFNDWVFDAARQPGETGIVRHEGDASAHSQYNPQYWGYHLIYFVGDNEPAWMGSVRSTMASDAQHDWLHELTEQYEIAQSDGANYIGK